MGLGGVSRTEAVHIHKTNFPLQENPSEPLLVPSANFKNIFAAMKSKLSCILWDITQSSDLQRNKHWWFMASTTGRSFGYLASCSHINRAKLVVLSVERRHVQPCQHSLILNFTTVLLWSSEYLHVTDETQLVPSWEHHRSAWLERHRAHQPSAAHPFVGGIL